MDTTLPTVALVYDFDGTLAPGNMQEFGLLQALGYDNPNDFWNLCDQIAKTNDAGGIAVPCMRTVKSNGGHSFAVYGNEKKRALAQQLLSEGRVNFACAADYTENSEMMVIVKRILDKIKADYTLTQHEVENRDTLNMFTAIGDSLE